MTMISFDVLLSQVQSKWILSQIEYDLNHGVSKCDIEKIINAQEIEKYYGFNHRIFARYLKYQCEQDDYITKPPEILEGVVECFKCGSKRVYSVTVQTRASDEPMSVKSRCAVCKNTWVIRG